MKRNSFLSLTLAILLAFTFSAQAEMQSTTPEAPMEYQDWPTSFSIPSCTVKDGVSVQSNAFFTHSESELYMIIEIHVNGEKKAVASQKVINTGNGPKLQEAWYSLKESDGTWVVYDVSLPAELQKSREIGPVALGFSQEEFGQACENSARAFMEKMQSHMDAVFQDWMAQ